MAVVAGPDMEAGRLVDDAPVAGAGPDTKVGRAVDDSSTVDDGRVGRARVVVDAEMLVEVGPSVIALDSSCWCRALGRRSLRFAASTPATSWITNSTASSSD